MVNLHQKFSGCLPEMSHGAEADCLSLLKITAMLVVVSNDMWNKL